MLLYALVYFHIINECSFSFQHPSWRVLQEESNGQGLHTPLHGECHYITSELYIACKYYCIE